MNKTPQSNEVNISSSISGAANLPRLAMINSFAGFGRCSTTIALPVISAMQVQVCPVPTSILSNHLAFPVCHYTDYTPHMNEYIEAWKHLDITFDGLYCGFLGSVAQMTIVEEFLQSFKPPLFLLDPVMGDKGKTYSSITSEHCIHLKKLLAHADVLTPNVTEACLLTDTPYQGEALRDHELVVLCQKLSALCPGRIVITGFRRDDSFMNFIWQNGKYTTYGVPAAGSSRHGTGDLFASVLVASLLRGAPLPDAVKKAVDFVALCLRESEKEGLPHREGIPFERYLYYLIEHEGREG